MSEVLPTAHIVYCELQMLLGRRHCNSWLEVQDSFDDYLTSLGPWSEEEIVGILDTEWGPDESRWPFTRKTSADYFHTGERMSIGKDG